MREILFRGKSIENGNWYVGSLCKSTFEKPISTNVVYKIQEFNQGFADEDEFEPTYISGFDEEVISETVGQYTGLTDKNNKKIFEGDIVRHYYLDDNFDEYDIGRVFWNGATCMFLRTCKSGDSCPQIWDSCEYEVIGNIHDNPELLKGGEG